MESSFNKTNTTLRNANNGSTDVQKLLNVTSRDLRDIIFISFFVIIFLVGVTGNVLVCFVFKWRIKRLSTMEKLIFRLGVVDLFASILNPFLYIYWQVTSSQVWHFGIVLCKILPSLNYFCDSISIGIIVLIAIDRGRKICQPLLPPYTMRQINISTILIIMGGVVMEIPRLVHAEVVPKYSCIVYHAEAPTFAYPSLVLLITRDTACIAVFAVVFYKMYKVLYSASKDIILIDQKKIQSRKRAFLLLVAMTALFILLVYPRDFLHIMYILLSILPIHYIPSKSVTHINTFLKILRATNSIVNVFLYAGFHQGFRKDLRGIPTKFTRKRAFKVRLSAERLLRRDDVSDRSTITSFDDPQAKQRNRSLRISDGNIRLNHFMPRNKERSKT